MAAWTAAQAAERLIQGLERDGFLLFSARTTRPLAIRMSAEFYGQRATLFENRPALSRWHPDYKEAFDAFMQAYADREQRVRRCRYILSPHDWAHRRLGDLIIKARPEKRRLRGVTPAWS